MTPIILFDFSEVIYNDLSSEVKIQNTFLHYVPISNYRFCRVKSSKMTQFLHFDLPEVKWPLTSHQSSKLKLQVLHHLTNPDSWHLLKSLFWHFLTLIYLMELKIISLEFYFSLSLSLSACLNESNFKVISKKKFIQS